MKNMKKFSILLVGCLMSLYVSAETEATTCTAPSLSVSEISYRSAKITWTRYSSHQSYEVQYSKAENWDAYRSHITLLSTVSTYTMGEDSNYPQLQPNTQYKVCVVAKCMNGGDVYSNIVSFTTPSTPVCKTPSNVQVSNITDKTATVSWTKGESGQAEWEIKCVSASGQQLTFRAYDDPTFVIFGLTYNTTYTVSVRAICYDDVTSDMFESNYSLSTSFTTSATPTADDIPQVEHALGTLECNPYTCRSVATVILSSTVKNGNPDHVAFYELESNGILTTLAYDPSAKTMDVYPTVGEHTYIVAAANNKINAPRRMPAAVEALPTAYWPTLISGQEVVQYDIWKVKVNYHTENHNVTVNADLVSNMGEFQIYTTAGQVEESTGKVFCGLNFKYQMNKGFSEDVSNAKVINYDASLVNDVLSLAVGSHTYSVYMVSREGLITWCDRFYITVVTPNCASGLVYTKWDDFMFVDNGEGGGKGRFVSYQWYNSGTKIEGANQQWMRTILHEGASPSGKYYVRIKDIDGNEIITCPKYFNEFPVSTVHNPHGSIGAPARKQIVDGQLRVEHNGKWYNAQGIEIK